MKYRIKLFLIAIGIVLCLSGCENEEKVINETPNEEMSDFNNDNDVTETVNEEEVIENERQIRIIESDDFSEERAWIKYQLCENEEITDYIGCIDKKGVVLFKYLAETVDEYTNFENSSAYVEFADGRMHIIDLNGKVLCELQKDEVGEFQLYGDGYYSFFRMYSGFDASGAITTIVDAMGNILYEGESAYYVYCGDGIFVGFNLGRTEHWYYNVDEYVRFEIEEMSESNFAINSPNWKNTCPYNGGYSVVKLEKGREYAIVSTTGEIVETIKANSYYYANAGISNDGVVVFWEDSPDPNAGEDPVHTFGYYDICNKEYIYTEQYIDKMRGNMLSTQEIYFSEDRIVIPLKGEDHYSYIAVFDKQWNEILPPTKGGSGHQYSCGRLVADLETGTVVLDENGKQVFSFEDFGYHDIGTYYANDVLRVGGGTYVDLDGNSLFETITVNE